MSKSHRLFVNGRYGQIHVRKSEPDISSKPPLVCTHMFPQSGRMFEKFITHAGQRRTVIAADFPGHGESDAPQQPITAEAYASAMWEAVDELALLESHGQIDLFGIHAGAKLAVEMAYQRPDDVRKIVLSSAAILLPEEVAQLKLSFKSIPLDEEGSRLQHLWRLVTRNRNDDMNLEMCATAFAEMLRGGEKYEWGHHAVFDYNLKFPQVLSSLTHPVALLNPGDELYEMTKRTVNYLQNVTVFDLPEWGHGFLEVKAETLADMIGRWLDNTEN